MLQANFLLEYGVFVCFAPVLVGVILMIRSLKAVGFGRELIAIMGLSFLAATAAPIFFFGWNKNLLIYVIGVGLCSASPFLVMISVIWAVFGKKSEKPWTSWQTLLVVGGGSLAGVLLKGVLFASMKGFAS